MDGQKCDFILSPALTAHGRQLAILSGYIKPAERGKLFNAVETTAGGWT